MSKEHLTPFQKGHKKLGGKKKGYVHVKTIIKKYLNENIKKENKITEKDETLTVQEHILLEAMAKALNGDDRAREDVLNRLYGKPKEHVEHEGSVNIIISDTDKGVL